MNRTAIVFAAVLASLSSGFAVDLINTNIVGATGLPGDNAYQFTGVTTTNNVSGSTLTGGDADPVVDGSTLSAGGGRGLFLIRTIVNVEDSTLTGGGGSDVTMSSALTSAVSASGGNGVGGLQANTVNITNSTVNGGAGGNVSASTSGGAQVITVNGGTGVGITGALSLNNVDVTGGTGGTAVTSDAAASSSANGGAGVLMTSGTAATITGGTIRGGDGNSFDNGDGTATADGGDAVSLTGLTGSVVIDGSSLIGGAGGTVLGADESSASGGNGLTLVNLADATVSGASITAGTAGTVNGVDDLDGSSVEIQGSTVSISDADLNGDMLFSGSGSSAISLQDIELDGIVRQTGGTVDMNAWDASYFDGAIIEDGTMNFNNSLFTLDGLFTLEASTAAANFNSGLTVSDGGTLDLGLGTVGGSDVTLESGSTVISEYDGSDLGSIDASGELTVESDSDWIIDAGDVEVATGTTFELATAATIVTNITEKDITFSGTGGEEGWLGGISSLTSDGTTLTATYGASSIDVALGVSGDTSTEFGKAMAALSMSLAPGSDGYNEIKSLADSLAAGGTLMTNTYVRTTEMSSTLIGLQSLFSDQIKDRTRSQMNFEGVGFPSSAPVGVSGWESLRSFSDSIENKYGYDELESLVDKVVPDVALPDNTLPVGWQAWGRGYGSFIEQDDTDDFAGYEATVGGGVVGLDKSIDNMLLGVGVGYAGTTLEGTSGRDAQADTMQAVAYFATHGEKAYFDASVSYAFNAVETEYDLMGYTGEYDAHTLGLYIGGGYAISLMDKVLFTPEASILNTLYSREGYTEASTLVGIPEMNYDSYDEWSHLAKLGATLSAIQKLDLYEYELAIQPELRAHWMHEFNAEMDDETYTMGTSGISIGATPMAREEDLVKVGAGMRLSKWGDDTTEVSLDVDLAYGSDGYDAYVIGGQIMHRF
jgi:uncharacterized protein with beta-barrel porin domain